MEEAGCFPEIYGVRSFGTVMPWEEQEDLNLIVNSESFDFAVSRDMDYLQNYLRKIRKRLQKMGFQGTPVIVDEIFPVRDSFHGGFGMFTMTGYQKQV